MVDYICKTLIAVELNYAFTDYKSFHLMDGQDDSSNKTKVKEKKLGQVNDAKYCFAVKSAVHMATTELYFYYRKIILDNRTPLKKWLYKSTATERNLIHIHSIKFQFIKLKHERNTWI